MLSPESIIIDVVFDWDKWVLLIKMNMVIVLIFILVYLLIKILIKRIKNKNNAQTKVIPVEFTYKVGGASIKYQIIRNYTNIEVAHKIYVELITRKAAIEIEEDKDVIQEVYNSWYNLFKITRDELKQITGDILSNNKTTNDLEKLLTDILNKGLRPHLTEYQANFKKWYSEELEKSENFGMSPQNIQKKFPEYKELVASMRNVNRLLIDYSKQLERVIRDN
ncbi:MAG: hypothetical protein SCALA702_00850 [Melioribacteraceae bacterium]|nr:MAG: hypothetical protein SCALA702_00850 [Melioribacteraceae bacterium]